MPVPAQKETIMGVDCEITLPPLEVCDRTLSDDGKLDRCGDEAELVAYRERTLAAFAKERHADRA